MPGKMLAARGWRTSRRQSLRSVGHPILQHFVQSAMAEAGFEVRTAIMRLYFSFRGGDRPKNAEQELQQELQMNREYGPAEREDEKQLSILLAEKGVDYKTNSDPKMKHHRSA